MSELIVEVREASLLRVGTLLPQHVNLTAEVPANDAGTWNLIVPLSSPMVPYLQQPGHGIVVTHPRTGETLFSGPSTSIGYSRTRENPEGVLTVSGETDEVIFRDALAWPQPSNPDPTIQSVARDVRSGEPHAIIDGFVSANIGPTASGVRKNPALFMDYAPEFPLFSAEASARFDNLLTLIQGIAGPNKILFRVLQAGTGLRFTMRSIDENYVRTVRMSDRDLASATVTLTAPGATRVFVGGDGESTARSFIEYNTEDSLAGEVMWTRRIERFAGGTGTLDALQTAGKEALNDDGFAKLSARFEPTENMRESYGTSWRIGDSAIVQVGAVEYKAPINGLVVKADKDGFRLGATVGELTKKGREIEWRVASLETYR